MSQNIYIKCLECGKLNHNRDYCEKCGNLINISKKRELEQQKRNEQKILDKKNKKPSKIESFFERTKNHPNFLVRTSAKMLYSIWWVVMIIGGILAWIAGAISA